LQKLQSELNKRNIAAVKEHIYEKMVKHYEKKGRTN